MSSKVSTNCVEKTNDSAVLSKLSMTNQKYATDPFLHHFVDPKHHQRIRSPLINHFYYLRFKAIEYAINRCQPLHQIISIGSGFDTTFLRKPDISFIEIDLPIVANNKANILIDSQLIDNWDDISLPDIPLNNYEPVVVIRSHNYCLIGADLRDTDSLKQLFIREGLTMNVTKDMTIGLFNECSLCYLTQDMSDSVIRALDQLYRPKCQSITYIGFEQLKSYTINNGFSRVMLNHFQTIGSPLKTFLTKSQIINRFKNVLNFESIEVLDMKTFFDDYIDGNEKERVNSLEMFDEWEEFDSVCSCYALTIANTLTSPTNSQTLNVLKHSSDEQIRDQIVCTAKHFNCNPWVVSRFGHSSCLTKDNKIAIFGGFGADSIDTKFHKRLSNLMTIDPKCDDILSFNSCDKLHEIQRIHSKIVELKHNLFFISGGRLSPARVMDNTIIKLLPDLHTYESHLFVDNNDCIPKVFRHVIVNDLNANKIIQIGGKVCKTQSDIGFENNSYYVLDTNTMKWTVQTKSNLLNNIYSHSGVSLDSNVFALNGGLDCHTNAFSTNYIDLIDERMSSVNTIKVEALNYLYSHHMKVFNQNKVLLVGGMSKTGPNNRLDVLDMRSANKILSSTDIVTQNALMLTNFSCELILGDEKPFLWLIGGGGNCFSFGTYFNDTYILPIVL